MRTGTIRVEVGIEIRRAIRDDLSRLAIWNAATERVVQPELRRQEAGSAVVLLALLKSFPCAADGRLIPVTHPCWLMHKDLRVAR